MLAGGGRDRSGSPKSLMTVSARIWKVPAGAVTRLHQLPKESRYEVYGVDGEVIIVSGASRSEDRL